MSSKPKTIQVLLAGLCISILPLIFIFINDLKINSNILDLLPDSGYSEETEASINHFTKNLSSSSLFLIKSESLKDALGAANNFEKALRQSDLFSEIKGKKSDSEFKQWYELYFPHRYHLLTEESRKILTEGKVKQFLENRVKKLYTPQASLYSTNLEEDPLMLFGDFIQELPSPGSFTINEGYLYKQLGSKHLIFISAKFKNSVFSKETQTTFKDVLDTFNENHSKVELLQLGFFPYAERARSQAESEVTFIGLGSILGIIFIFLLVFRSPIQLFQALVTIAGGVAWALLLTQLIYGQVHIITIVFGATLTGVCVDYIFHWFCHTDNETSKVKKGILWGSLTSLIAYAALFITDFPGLKQIAVFSSIGIITAVLQVLFLFPFSTRNNFILPPSVQMHFSRKSQIYAIIILSLFAVFGLKNIHSNDDIRILQNRPIDLIIQEEEFRSYLSPFDNSRFLLVSADSNDKLISAEKEIIISLEGKAFDGSLSISSLLPTESIQVSDHALISKVVNSPEFKSYCEDLGFEENIYSNTKKNLSASSPLSLSKFIQHPAAAQVKQLYINQQKPSSIILLNGIKDDKEIRKSLTENVTYIDKVEDTSKVLGKFRFEAAKLTFWAYIGIFILLALFFNYKFALRAIFPPLAAAFLTCGLWSLFGFSFNLFNILSLILILGIGIDYSIFYALAEKEDRSTETAISLSTVSTLLAFGLLSFSSTPALSSFGMTLTLGIVFSYCIAPMSKI